MLNRLSLVIPALALQIHAVDARAQAAEDKSPKPELRITSLSLVKRGDAKLFYRLVVENEGDSPIRLTDASGKPIFIVQAYLTETEEEGTGRKRGAGGFPFPQSDKPRTLAAGQSLSLIYSATLQKEPYRYLMVVLRHRRSRVASEPATVPLDGPLHSEWIPESPLRATRVKFRVQWGRPYYQVRVTNTSHSPVELLDEQGQPRFQVRAYLSADEVFGDDDKQVGGVAVTAVEEPRVLPPGKSTTTGRTLQLPNGPYRYLLASMFVGPLQEKEWVSTPLSSNDPPDVALASLALVSLGLVERSGPRMKYRAEVKNRGTGSIPGRSITVQAYQSQDAVWDASDPPAGGSRLMGIDELRPNETRSVVETSRVSPGKALPPEEAKYLIVKVTSETSRVRPGHPDSWKAVALDSPLIPAEPEPVVTRAPWPWWMWLGIVVFGIVWLSFMGWGVMFFGTMLRGRKTAGPVPVRGVVLVVRMVCGFFVAVGFCWLVFGVGPTFWNGSQSHAWPTVEGLIEESSVTEGSTRDKDPSTGMTERRTTYHHHLRYRYEVSGHEYHSNRKRLGGTRSHRNRRAAEALVRADYAGKSVMVHYDPGDPSLAVLEPGVTEGAYVQLVISTVFVFLGLIVAWAFGVLPFGKKPTPARDGPTE